MPTGYVLGTFSVAALAVAAIAAMLMRLLTYRRAPEREVDLERLSLARYAPLEHLFDSSDLDFLAAQPGFHPAMRSAYRNRRRKVCRMYLKELAADFRVVHARARQLVAQAPEQYSELVGVLFRQQAAFWRGMARVEFGLWLDAACIGELNPRGPLDALEALLAEVAAIRTPAASAA